jgi:hypothetical protein
VLSVETVSTVTEVDVESCVVVSSVEEAELQEANVPTRTIERIKNFFIFVFVFEFCLK